MTLHPDRLGQAAIAPGADTIARMHVGLPGPPFPTFVWVYPR